MLQLIRYQSSKFYTLGLITLNGEWVADTLELPWQSNTPFISCIPLGVYSIQYSESAHRVGPCFEVLNVPGREGVLIHAANDVEELEGCIAVGIKCMQAVYQSRDTLDKLIAVIGKSETLEVKSL